MAAGHRTDGRMERRAVRLSQIKDVHDAQQADKGIREEISVDRPPLPLLHLKPVLADGFVEALVEQGKAGDHADGGGDQQGNADLLAVLRHMGRQRLPL